MISSPAHTILYSYRIQIYHLLTHIVRAKELKISDAANKAARYCQDEAPVRYEEEEEQPQVVSLVDSYNVMPVRADILLTR